MKYEKKYILETCFHCGNKGLMKVEYKTKSNFGGPIVDKCDEIIDWDFEEEFEWYLLSCPVCKYVTLKETYTNESSCSPYTGEQYYDEKILYPQCTINYKGVPKNIKTAFESALKVKNIDMAICLLSLRRVLEAICKDKGAKGKNLDEMLKNMIEKNILPDMFNDACWIIRELGNSAAHADNKIFVMHQVNQTIIFMQNIINYLYTLPLEMKKMKESIEIDKKRKEEKEKNFSNREEKINF